MGAATEAVPSSARAVVGRHVADAAFWADCLHAAKQQAGLANMLAAVFGGDADLHLTPAQDAARQRERRAKTRADAEERFLAGVDATDAADAAILPDVHPALRGCPRVGFG